MLRERERPRQREREIWEAVRARAFSRLGEEGERRDI